MAKTALDKLGWAPGMDGAVLGAPDGLAAMAAAVRPGPAQARFWRLAFTPDVAALTARAPDALAAYRPNGLLWFAYPKKTSPLWRDLHRNHAAWDVVTQAGFLPVTQIALDHDWSALRFRPRDEIRTLTRRSERAG